MKNPNVIGKTLATCAKCDGKGRISAFYHYANGVCFWCKGSGKVTVDKLNKSGELDRMVGHLLYTAIIVLDAEERGNTERADFYINLMIPNLRKVGTERARQVLKFVSAGRWQDDDTGEWKQMEINAARELCGRIVAKGREVQPAANQAA